MVSNKNFQTNFFDIYVGTEQELKFRAWIGLGVLVMNE